MSNPPLILASSSVYRKELLARLGLPFETFSPEIDETPHLGESPYALSVRLAREKALAVRAVRPGAVIIASDQVCELNGKPLGKPGTFARGREQLRAMAGRKAVFHTALCVIDVAGHAHECVSDTVITMRQLTDRAIDDYLTREKPFACAGSAKIERLGIALMESVESDDPTSLIGLPLMHLTTFLIASGVPPVRGLV